jgi:prepilin-type N-terminal cleavage/methylation domain-containing protein
MIERGVINGRRRGLTLIEMVMVLVIIGIVARYALPAINYTRFRADGAGRAARILLQEAQRNAITRQSNVIVSFDLLLNRYRIVQDYNNNDTINTTDWVQWRTMPDGAVFAQPSWTGATAADGSTPAAALNGPGLQTVSGLSSVIFRRDGSASTDLNLFVTVRPTVPTEYREITVAASTGRTDIWKYTSNGWVRMTQ